MAEPRRDVELEQELRALGSQLVFPETPDLTARVRARTRARPPQRFWGAWGPGWRAVAAAVLLLGVVTAALVGWPDARAGIAQRLGLRGATIEQVPALPTASPSPAISTVAPALGEAWALGNHTTLAGSETSVGVLVPADSQLGPPAAVYQRGSQVTLVYGGRRELPADPQSGVALLLTETPLPPGGIDAPVLRKVVGPGTSIEQLDLDGNLAFWLEGAPHQLYLPDSQGRFQANQVWLAGNVLLWEQHDKLMRIETTASKETASRIAMSVP